MRPSTTFATRRRGLSILVVATLGMPALLFAALSSFPMLDRMFMSVTFHLIVVSAIAASAVGIAIVAAVAAGRSRDGSTVYVALGCLAVGGFMLAHGLATPGVTGVGPNLWVSRLPNLGIAAFALSQLAAITGQKRFLARAAAKRPWFLLAVPSLVLAVALTALLVSLHSGGPTSAPSEVVPNGLETALSKGLMVLAAVILLGVGVVHWKRWRLSGDGVVLALAIACWLSVEALVSLRFGRTWHVSWWDYHALLLVGFGSAVSSVVATYLRTRGEGSIASAYSQDPLDQIARGYPEALTTLVAAVEARDAYTSGHSRRVTETAARIAQCMGIRGDALRRLVWGAELHDIGKIGISDSILNKAGKLTHEERLHVEEHPVIGWEIARQARSLNEVLEVIRHHHERVDGTGYPDGLSGEQIPLSARIVAVADVWDALTSDRSYRAAWPAERALQVMREGRGTQFDEEVLDAFMGCIGAATPEVRRHQRAPRTLRSTHENSHPAPALGRG